MKAKEYIEQYRQAVDKNREISLICRDMILEITSLAEKRQCKLRVSYRAVFDEIESKWKAFARLCPEAKPEGLRNFLWLKFPEMCNELGIKQKAVIND